ncbi:hypothetical protein ABT039_22840 [Streptomyces lasiicapitis]|uniref:hypothetical protein n=1 Tax=Streptomyces lasiicapitis TaxID=1923961 RepID=UPI0033238CC3
MATRTSRTTTRSKKPAAKKAAAPTSVPPDTAVLAEARAKADGIVADAEKLAAAQIADAARDAETTVQGLLDEAQQQADALHADVQNTSDILRAEAERAAEQMQTSAKQAAQQLLDDARAEAEELRTNAVGAAEETRANADAEAAQLLARATEDADRLRVTASEDADAVRAEANTQAEELLARARTDADGLLGKARAEAEHLRADAEQVLARGREDAERIRTDAAAEADRLRAAGAADRDRARDEAASVRAESERLRHHAQETADALRTQAEQTAHRVRTAAAAEATQLRKDATDDADRTRRSAEEEINRQRATARSTVADAVKHAEHLVDQAKTEAAGILDRAKTQARELTAKAETTFNAAEATLTQANGDAAILRADAEQDRGQAADEMARALSKTVQKLENRKLKDADAERRRTAKRTEKEQRKAGRPTWTQKTRKALLAIAVRFLVIVPILAPMVVAWTGQSGFAMKVLSWSFAASLIYAAAYELTTAYCAWLYDQARRDGDKGWEYRIATWLFGFGAAVQQWWHYSSDWSATPKAVTFSAMSMVGVVLWELFARLVHRRKLRKDKNLPPALPSLGMARWTRYPVRSWTARSLMIDNPVRWANSDAAWTQAGRILADRTARRTGKAYADLYLVTVRRSGPDHGPAAIPAAHALLDRLDRAALPAAGPERPKELDRAPDRTANTADQPGSPDRAGSGAAASADREPGSTARSGRDRKPEADRTSTDRTAPRRMADGPPFETPDGLDLNAREQRAIDVLRSQNRSITKRSIGEVIRSEGGSIASDRAAEIARHYPRTLKSA